jgi:hypothetical protein
MDLQDRLKRDEESACQARQTAEAELKQESAPAFALQPDFAHGTPRPQLSILDGVAKRRSTLQAIVSVPFHGMAEAVIKSDKSRKVLWYANEHTFSNEVLGDIRIVTWTHPGFQLALVGELDEEIEAKRNGYAFTAIRPVARARFRQVLPNIAGVYDPGGSIRPDGKPPRVAAGLKAVKLDLTTEQVFAFVARMDGYLMVSGAPGTGKTTVALQRIRFLFDQQNETEFSSARVPYEPELTSVFLANKNLIAYSRQLLKDELGIPQRVVHYVPEFIHFYLDRTWQSKNNARPSAKKISAEEARAREAFFNLCSVRDLRGLWQTYEQQLRTRLAETGQPDWLQVPARAGARASAEASALLEVLKSRDVRGGHGPTESHFRMGSLFHRSRLPYERCRQLLNEAERATFDTKFRNWLFWVYDPLDAVKTYFLDHRYEGRTRIQGGTGDVVPADEVIAKIQQDWDVRQYRIEEASWLAWLLRFALPEEQVPEDKFREVPPALPDVHHGTEHRLTHVVIDEAQDLSVQEASLLASLVHPKGSLTVSADFHQVVSPVHGMTDAEALKFGMPIRDQKAYKQYPFTKNMRQSREVGLFLVDFYRNVFHEFPKFDPSDRTEKIKPVLYVGRPTLFPGLIKQMMSVLSRSSSISTIALLQINEDAVALQLLRAQLQQIGVRVAATDSTEGGPGQLITTSVERAKGLEFDVCLVLGLDDVERSSLNFSKNRAYVAISRPTQRLFMLCQQFPPLLQGIEKDLYDRHNL